MRLSLLDLLRFVLAGAGVLGVALVARLLSP
jgi:hypothetical protein